MCALPRRVDCRIPRLLVTTRIKGILPDVAEVELELLSLAESVALLLSVAQLDDSSSCAVLEIESK